MNENEKIMKSLIDNSKAAMYAAIEIHNKPIFPYRYEVSIILLINSWELILKAFLFNMRSDLKIIKDDGSTMPFEDCVANTQSTIGNSFMITNENLLKLYKYRCNIIHFYEDRIDIILYSLLSKNVLLYHEFLLLYFGINIAHEANLMLLPIGFKKPISPLDFISNESEINESSESVKDFIKSIVNSTEYLQSQGIDESIIVNYKMSVINENRVKNSDIVAAISKDKVDTSIFVEKVINTFKLTDDENAPKFRIEEDNLFKTAYTETYKDVYNYCHMNFTDFKANSKFNELLRSFKEKPVFYKKRYLNVVRENGSSQC